jgi:hypothetical protein
MMAFWPASSGRIQNDGDSAMMNQYQKWSVFLLRLIGVAMILYGLFMLIQGVAVRVAMPQLPGMLGAAVASALGFGTAGVVLFWAATPIGIAIGRGLD